MIKVILLDNGGVLVDDSWPTYVRETSARLGLSEDEFRTKTRSIVRPALIGEIDRQEFTKKLIETIGSDEGVPKLGTVKPIRKGIESWLSDLKQRDYRLAILSNDFGDFAGNNAKYWHYERFCGDEIFYSTKLGVSKPNKDAFIAVLGKLNVRPTETIFLDDKKRNTDAASELGMNVIQFESLEQAKRELEIILEREDV